MSVRLENRLLSLELLDRGATIQRLRVGGIPVVLGFEDPADYAADRSYQGCVIGRVANRIGGARFTLDGAEHRVRANEGANCLHGGVRGFDKRDWRLVGHGERNAAYVHVSEDGEEGFPGRLETVVRFTLDQGDLAIAYEARCDRPTPISLTHHLYFNLAGAGTILEHELMAAAEAYTPVRPDLIPTGALATVEGTPFDLRAPRRIGDALAQPHPQTALCGGFDHNWALVDGDGPALMLASPESGVRMTLFTDQPGLQLYSSQGLGPPFPRHGGLVIEPQGFPDAVNQPGFPPVILRPGEVYRRHILYRFELG